MGKGDNMSPTTNKIQVSSKRQSARVPNISEVIWRKTRGIKGCVDSGLLRSRRRTLSGNISSKCQPDACQQLLALRRDTFAAISGGASSEVREERKERR